MNEFIINNKKPDPRVTPAVQQAVECILTGDVQHALILYTTGTAFRSATVNAADDRHINIGLAQMYLMCQQAWLTADMINPDSDPDSV